jgi:hypothetical protein
MRALLRVDPWVPRREVFFAPAWPEQYGPIRVHNLPIGNSRVTISVSPDGAGLTGLTDRIEVIHSPRPPVTDVHPAGGF